MSTSGVPLVVAAVLLAGATSSSLRAQSCTGKPVPGARTEWFPRGVIKGPDPVSAADRAFIESRLASIEGLVRKTVFGTPQGYEAAPGWNYSAPLNRTRLSRYSFNLAIWCPTVKATGGDGAMAINVAINPDPQLWSESDRPRRDVNGDAIYLNRVRTANQFGSTAMFGDLNLEGITSEGAWVLFTAGDESPTLPVSREEYLRMLIFEVEGNPNAKKKSAYQEYLDAAPDRKKARDETVAIIAKSDPAKAEQLRKSLEKAEQDNGALIRQSDEQGSKGVAKFGDKLRAQLAAMTPQERAAPAYLVGLDFVERNTPNALAVVRENPAFYRARTSPLEPRLVVVRLAHNYKALIELNRQMYRELDWAALKALVASATR